MDNGYTYHAVPSHDNSVRDPEYERVDAKEAEALENQEIEALENALEEWVKGTEFQSFMAIVIFGNAAVIGLETDVPQLKWLWDICENTFLLVFVVEILIRLSVLRLKFFTDKDLVGNLFDLVLVVCGVVDFVLTKVLDGDLGQLGLIMKAARLLRILRLFRLFKMIKQLYMLASGFLESSVAVFWVSVLCGLSLYICAIFLTRTLGTQTAADDEFANFYQDRFGSIGRSMFTLFELMSNPDLKEMERVMFGRPVMMIFFVAFIIYGSFAMLSILTGVISEGMIEKGNIHKEEMRFEEERKKNAFMVQLRLHFEASDTDGDGTMTREEFVAKIPEMIRMFKDHGFSYSEADLEMVFDLVDFDKGGTIEVEEFLQGMTSFTANVGDLPLQFLRLQSNIFLATRRLQDSVDKRIGSVEKSLTTLDGKLNVLSKRNPSSIAKRPGCC